MITSSPWGAPDLVEQLAMGIFDVVTPSHGGFYLEPDVNAQVPAAWRAASFNRQAEHGWYEEDCDAVMVVLTFPTVFAPKQVSAARQAFASMFPALKMPAPIEAGLS